MPGVSSLEVCEAWVSSGNHFQIDPVPCPLQGLEMPPTGPCVHKLKWIELFGCTFPGGDFNLIVA